MRGFLNCALQVIWRLQKYFKHRFCIRGREDPVKETRHNHSQIPSWWFSEFGRGLASLLISVIIHNLPTGELANIRWSRCAPSDGRGRIACPGARQKNVFELNPKSWVRFKKMGRSEEKDWPFHFKIKANYEVHHRREKTWTSRPLSLPHPLVLLQGSSC